MLVLLRSIQTLLLILVIGIGTWVPASAAACCDLGPSIGHEAPVVQAANDGESEEKPSGESQDSDGEGAGDGKLLNVHSTKLDVPFEWSRSTGCVNEDLPLFGRETIRDLFRPPRS